MAKIIHITVTQQRTNSGGRLAEYTYDDGRLPEHHTVSSEAEVDQLARDNGLDPDNPDHVAWEGGTDFE